ncbi:hypothetical protein VNO78_14923 [Psophocarpus tetragonolobus]|uniref:Uncharacterized protein n=1 Tax=Psophocarpus tetragonolobus TaxID=3891 RepID=A0AAN9SDP8_PSOTE
MEKKLRGVEGQFGEKWDIEVQATVPPTLFCPHGTVCALLLVNRRWMPVVALCDSFVSISLLFLLLLQ